MNAFLHFVQHEWYFAVPMFLMAITAVALVIWRALLNSAAKTRMDEFLPVFQTVLQKEGVAGAVRLCREETGQIPNKLYLAGLEASPLGLAAMKRSMASSIELEIVPYMNFLLAPILAIAKIATMVGLLGTVISMISTFNAISDGAKGGGGAVSAQAQSIGLALFATALGLMTAIPLVFAHVMFKDGVHRFEIKLKSAAQKFLILFQTIKPKPGIVQPQTPIAEDLPTTRRR